MIEGVRFCVNLRLKTRLMKRRPFSSLLKRVINPKKLVLIVGDCGVAVSGVGVELFKERSPLLAIHCISEVPTCSIGNLPVIRAQKKIRAAKRLMVSRFKYSEPCEELLKLPLNLAGLSSNRGLNEYWQIWCHALRAPNRVRRA